MGRRTLLLIVSILLAAVGTALIALYVKSANDRAQTSVGTVDVLVVTRTIPMGASMTATGAVLLKPVTRQETLPDSFTNVAQLAGKYATTELFPGTVVRQAMVTGKATSSTGAPHSDINYIGFTVDVVLANRAAGLLNPGDSAELWAGTRTGKVTKPLIAQVLVLSVGAHRNVTSASDDTVPNTTVGLDVKPSQIQDIINALDAQDTLYLGVLGKDPTGK